MAMKAERQRKEPQQATSIQSKGGIPKLSFVDNRLQMVTQMKLIQSIQKSNFGLIQHKARKPIKINTKGAIRKSTSTIQRAVGFEFETGWYIRKSDPKLITRTLRGGILGTATSTLVGIGSTIMNTSPNWIPLTFAGAIIGGLSGFNYALLPESAVSRRLLKGEKVISQKGFTMEADDAGEESEIEFVVQPPIEERAGENSVKDVMDRVVGLANSLNRYKDEQQFSLNNVTKNNNDAAYTIFPKMGSIAANPQVTAGVRLDRINAFANHAKEPRSVANRLLSMNGNEGKAFILYNSYAQGAVAYAKNQSSKKLLRVSSDLTGLVTLLISYLIAGADYADKSVDVYYRSLPYIKHLTILMARTDFATLFKQLPKNEQVYFKQNPGKWLDMIMNGAKRVESKDWSDGIAGKVVERKKRPEDDEDYEDFPVSVSREDWLYGLLNGYDLMSASYYNSMTKYGREMKDELEGMGKLGSKVDKVGKDKKTIESAGIFEFRKVEDNMPLDKWCEFAIDAYNYIVKLNNTQRPVK